jgi:hypothetical protein
MELLDSYNFEFQSLKTGLDSSFTTINTDLEFNGKPLLTFIQNGPLKQLFVFTISDDSFYLLARAQLPPYTFNFYISDFRNSILAIDQFMTAIKITFGEEDLFAGFE